MDLVSCFHQQQYDFQEIDCNILLSKQNALCELDFRKLNQEAVVGKTLVYTTNQSKYGPSIKIHERLDFDFKNLSWDEVNRLETDVVKCVQGFVGNKDGFDVDLVKNQRLFDNFLKKTSASIHSDFGLNEKLRGPYVIYSYIMHNLKKMECVDGFDTSIVGFLNANSTDSRILQRIRTCLEIILVSCQNAFRNSVQSKITLKLPCLSSNLHVHYDNDGIAMATPVNSYHDLKNLASFFFDAYFLIKFYDYLLSLIVDDNMRAIHYDLGPVFDEVCYTLSQAWA